MEHYQLWHQPFAKGRIENGLPPSPGKRKRPFYIRWAEAISVMRGNSIGVRCYDDMELPAEEDQESSTK